MMIRTRKVLACAVALAMAGCAGAGGEPAASAYAGQQQRAIKALSDQEVAGLLAGQGMGFAKAAELNGYPGPLHTLELKDQLGLSAEQASASAALMKSHKARAAEIGAALVEAERHLDGVFSRQQAGAAAVDEATARIGVLQAQLRAEHLKTHLAQTALLSTEQVRRYTSLRGYSAGSHSHSRGSGHRQ